jgi:hypothetical protein
MAQDVRQTFILLVITTDSSCVEGNTCRLYIQDKI